MLPLAPLTALLRNVIGETGCVNDAK